MGQQFPLAPRVALINASIAIAVAGGLFLSPLLALSRAEHLLRTGATTFLRTLWTGRRPSHQRERIP